MTRRGDTRPAATRPVATRPHVIAAMLRAKLQRLARDRTTLVFMLAVPFLLILLIGVAIPDPSAIARPVGLVAAAPAEGPGALGAPVGTAAGGPGARLLDALAREPLLDLRPYSDEAALAAAIRRGFLVAGVVVPDDLDARVERGEPVAVRFVVDPGRPPPLATRTAVAQAVGALAADLRTVAVVAERFGVAADAVAAALRPDAGTSVEVRSVGASASERSGGFAYTAPAYLVLFVFINTLVTAWALPADRAAGLTARILAAPVGAATLLLGTWTYQLLVGLLQAGLIVAVGAALFGVDWGDPLAIAAIVLLFTLAATGASLLLGSFARTPEQVTALAPPIGIALGMLGGCMWPLEVVGPTLRAIGHGTPHAWAVSAFGDVIGGGAGLTDIAPQLTALAGFALLFGALALVVARRRLGT